MKIKIRTSRNIVVLQTRLTAFAIFELNIPIKDIEKYYKKNIIKKDDKVIFFELSDKIIEKYYKKERKKKELVHYYTGKFGNGAEFLFEIIGDEKQSKYLYKIAIQVINCIQKELVKFRKKGKWKYLTLAEQRRRIKAL